MPGWASRALRWLLLLALVAGAGAAGVDRAVHQYRNLPHSWLSGGVAAAPWAILLIAVWLWFGMIRQVLNRRTRRAPEPELEPEPMPPTIMDESIVPGFPPRYDETVPLPRPAPPLELEAPPVPETFQPAEPEYAPEPEAAEPDEPEDEPAEPEAPRMVAMASLPTDVRLVGPRNLADTHPDGIKLPDTDPDGIPTIRPAAEPADDATDEAGDDRAEDPDAGEDDPWAEAYIKPGESPPPFGQFRSSPTPPRD